MPKKVLDEELQGHKARTAAKRTLDAQKAGRDAGRDNVTLRLHTANYERLKKYVKWGEMGQTIDMLIKFYLEELDKDP
jgi:hypothetical protein